MPPLVQLPPELWPGRSPCGSAFQGSGPGEEPADRLLQRPHTFARQVGDVSHRASQRTFRRDDTACQALADALQADRGR
jgi:hypothetical protein